jgi:hypothetical protein
MHRDGGDRLRDASPQSGYARQILRLDGLTSATEDDLVEFARIDPTASQGLGKHPRPQIGGVHVLKIGTSTRKWGTNTA